MYTRASDFDLKHYIEHPDLNQFGQDHFLPGIEPVTSTSNDKRLGHRGRYTNHRTFK